VLETACPLNVPLPHMFHSVFCSGCSKDVLNSLHTCSYHCKLIWVVSLSVAMSRLFINEAFVELRFSNRWRKHINLPNRLSEF